MRILLVDDDPLVRVGLRAVLQSEDGWEVVGEVDDGALAAEAAVRFAPDVVLMDVRMPEVDGLTATRQVLETANPPPKVIVLTTFEVDEYVYEALKVGASGFVLKRVPPAELIEAVRVVAAGDSLVFPAVTRTLIEKFSGGEPEQAELPALSDREQDVLRLLAKGHSNREIAGDLYVSSETVKTHVGSILLKLGVRDRTQAVIAAYESGFVVPGE